MFLSNVRIVEGTGAPAARGSVLVQGERIERVASAVTAIADFGIYGETLAPMWIRTGQVTALTCRRSAQERSQSPYRQLATKHSKNQWTGTDMLMLTFEIARPEGEQVWLELDNVRFY